MKAYNFVFSQIFSEKFHIINLNEAPKVNKAFVGVVLKMSSSINRSLINRALAVIKFLSFQKPKVTKLKYFYISKQKNFVFTAHSTLRDHKLLDFFYIFYSFCLNSKFFPVNSRYVIPSLNISQNGSTALLFSNFYSFLKFKNFFYSWVHPVNILFLFNKSSVLFTSWLLSFYSLPFNSKKCH